MLELEFTFLLKAFPPTFLEEIKSEHYQNIKAKKEMIDCYFPPEITHPKIRLRQNGKKFELTKKEPLSAEDASIQQEQTISLTESEFTFFSQLKGKKVHKSTRQDIFMNILLEKLQKLIFFNESFCDWLLLILSSQI